MNIDDLANPEPDPATVPLGALQASLFRLMTLYSVMPCLGKARTIVRLLSALIQHPDLRDWPPQQEIYLQMLDTWNQLAHEAAAVRCVDNARPTVTH